MKNSVVCGIAIALISLALNSTFVYPQAVGSVERSKAAQDFLKRYGVSRILLPHEFVSNPYPYEGKTVAVATVFASMQSKDTALFMDGVGNAIVASGVPYQKFTPGTQGVIVIGKAAGQKKVDMPVMGSVNVPYIKAIDVHICPKNSDTCGGLISLRR